VPQDKLDRWFGTFCKFKQALHSRNSQYERRAEQSQVAHTGRAAQFTGMDTHGEGRAFHENEWTVLTTQPG